MLVYHTVCSGLQLSSASSATMEDDSDKECKTGVNLAGVDKPPFTQVSAGLPYFLFWFAAI